MTIAPLPMPYNIVIVSPPGYGFAETFREIAETLLHGLRALGHECRLQTNDFDPAATNIVLGGHLLGDRAAELPPGTILYNFEQVHGTSPWIKPAYVDAIRRFPTWDYSARNVEAWKRFVPDAAVRVTPLGYVPELTRIEPAPDQDIDVLFYGVINDRRARVLNALTEAGLRVVAVTGKFGAERDALIARAKVVLNLHFFETKIFEIPRVSYLLANRKAVVAEVDAGTEIDPGLSGAIAGVPYDALVDTCVGLAFDDAERAALEERGFSYFSGISEASILREALAADAVRGASAESVPLPKWINVGSGKGWNLEALNLDVDPMWKPDLLADLNVPLPPPAPIDLGRFGARMLPAGYFEEIHASHVLEHLSNLQGAMESFLRLLAPGGILSVEVPYDLSFGAWQDPTHVRAFNERSWLYYTEWFWYLGWQEFRFEPDHLEFVLSEYGEGLMKTGGSLDSVTRMPRAVDAMRVRLKKVPLTEAERQRVAQRWTT